MNSDFQKLFIVNVSDFPFINRYLSQFYFSLDKECLPNGLLITFLWFEFWISRYFCVFDLILMITAYSEWLSNKFAGIPNWRIEYIGFSNAWIWNKYQNIVYFSVNIVIFLINLRFFYEYSTNRMKICKTYRITRKM